MNVVTYYFADTWDFSPSERITGTDLNIKTVLK